MPDIFEQIRDALQNLVTLQIATVVGDARPQRQGGATNLDIVDWSTNPALALTRIDLLQGDVTTVLAPAFVTGDYQALREFHLAREREGFAMVEKNIAALVQLYQAASEVLGRPRAQAARPAAAVSAPAAPEPPGARPANAVVPAN